MDDNGINMDVYHLVQDFWSVSMRSFQDFSRLKENFGSSMAHDETMKAGNGVILW